MTSWKTTAAGIIALVVLLLTTAGTILSDGFGAVDWGTLVPAVMAAIAALFARDNDTTSEAAGAR